MPSEIDKETVDAILRNPYAVLSLEERRWLRKFVRKFDKVRDAAKEKQRIANEEIKV